MSDTQIFKTPRHSLLENLQGQVFGIIMIAFGISMLQALGLITGQTAGLAFVISYATGMSFGLVFFLINLPFYVLAIMRLGWGMTLRTLIAVTAISVLTSIAPHLIQYTVLDPWAGAIIAGLSIGIGLIGLFRHGSSSGGIGILALYVQEKTGFRAGWLQLGLDVAIFTAAAFILNWHAVFISLIGAIALNILVAFNHRKDWYVAH